MGGGGGVGAAMCISEGDRQLVYRSLRFNLNCFLGGRITAALLSGGAQ